MELTLLIFKCSHPKSSQAVLTIPSFFFFFFRLHCTVLFTDYIIWLCVYVFMCLFLVLDCEFHVGQRIKPNFVVPKIFHRVWNNRYSLNICWIMNVFPNKCALWIRMLCDSSNFPWQYQFFWTSFWGKSIDKYNVPKN